MLVDHVNKYLFGASHHEMYAAGRICMPLFVFVLGFNLARPGALERGRYQRVAKRLLVYGLLASIPFVLIQKLAGGWWPLNILFTLLVAVVVAWLLDLGGRWPTIAAVLVEYWWPAIAACLFVWAYFRRPAWIYLVGFVASIGSLYLINGNHWALVSLPIIFLAQYWRISIPRLSRFFYVFYPLHLAIIWSFLESLR
jgi:TraX protein